MPTVKKMVRVGFAKSESHHEHTHQICAELKQILNTNNSPAQVSPLLECAVCPDLKKRIACLREDLKHEQVQKEQTRKKETETRIEVNGLRIENDKLVQLKAENSALRASLKNNVMPTSSSENTHHLANKVQELTRLVTKQTNENQVTHTESRVFTSKLDESRRAQQTTLTSLDSKITQLAHVTSAFDSYKRTAESTQTELDKLKSQIRLDNSSMKGKLGENMMLAYMQDNYPDVQFDCVGNKSFAGDILCHINFTTPTIRLMLEVKNKKVPTKADREKAHRDTILPKNAYDSSLVVCYVGHNQDGTNTFSAIDQRTFFVYGAGEDGGNTRFRQAFMIAIFAGMAHKNRVLSDTNTVADITLPCFRLLVDDRVTHREYLRKQTMYIKEQVDAFNATTPLLVNSFSALKSVVSGTTSQMNYDYCAGLLNKLNGTKPTHTNSNNMNNNNNKRKREKKPAAFVGGGDNS
jgi:hypothetical protein